jgi:hypothetical protein
MSTQAKLPGAPQEFTVRAGAAIAAVRDGPAGSRFEVVGLGLQALRLACGVPVSLGVCDRLRLRVETGQLRCDDLTCTVTHVAQHVGAPDGRFDVDVHLDTPTPEQGRELAAIAETLRASGDIVEPPASVLEQEVIEDPARLAVVFRALFAGEYSAVLWRRNGRGEVLGAPRPAKLTRDGRLLTLFDGATAREGGHGGAELVDVEVRGFSSVFEFAVDPQHVDHLGRLEPPSRIVRLRYRRHRRVAAGSGMSVTLRHPMWPELAIKREVLNASLDGLSVSTDLRDDLLFPGLTLHDLTLSWKGGPALTFKACVRHVSAKIHGTGSTCGLHLTPASDDVRLAWNRELEPLLHPRTRLDEGNDEEVWRLYGDSGYFSLSEKSPAHFAPLHDAFLLASERMRQAPELAARVVCGGGARVEATVSEIKPYAGTWLGYQGARYADGRPLVYAGNDVIRDVYVHAMEHPYSDPAFRWHITYVQDVAYLTRVHYDTPARLAQGGRACVVPFRAFEIDCNLAPSPTDREVTIDSPTADEEVKIVAFFTAHFPPIFVEAHDLTAERLHLDAIKAAWAKAGLLRDRRLWVARQGEVAVAALVADFAEDGVHLFGLLDAMRIVPLVDADVTDAAVALLNTARRWYGEQGKLRCVYFQEAGSPQLGDRLPLVDMGGASTAILSAQLLPEQVEDIIHVTAPKPPSKGERD